MIFQVIVLEKRDIIVTFKDFHPNRGKDMLEFIRLWSTDTRTEKIEIRKY